jgi:hypothetical protein
METNRENMKDAIITNMTEPGTETAPAPSIVTQAAPAEIKTESRPKAESPRAPLGKGMVPLEEVKKTTYGGGRKFGGGNNRFQKGKPSGPPQKRF